MNAIADTITRRIRAKQRGWVFTPRDFLDVAAQATVNQTLSRLARKGIIRRLDHGVYDFPKYHDKIGILSPDTDDLAKAIADQRIFPSGAAAANYLGLSTQVPMKPVFLTNGLSRTRTIDGRTIVFKHAKVPIMDDITDKANFMLQALFYLGQDHIDSTIIQKCANRLNDKDMRDLQKVTSRIPAWLASIILQIRNLKYGYLRKAA